MSRELIGILSVALLERAQEAVPIGEVVWTARELPRGSEDE